MADGFDRIEVADLLIRCHRRCCVCHRFCGSKIEIDHIVQRADGGGNEIDNAIAVCFDCHAEIHHYNNKHPKGRKFSPEEIKGHKKQWLEICENKPEIFVQPLNADVGCLGALIDELEFNFHSSNNLDGSFYATLRDEQFRKAISAGIISILAEDVRLSLLSAYDQIGKANNAIAQCSNVGIRGGGMIIMETKGQIEKSTPFILEAKDKLQSFLQSED
jgi:HNH endonuclease